MTAMKAMNLLVTLLSKWEDVITAEDKVYIYESFTRYANKRELPDFSKMPDGCARIFKGVIELLPAKKTAERKGKATVNNSDPEQKQGIKTMPVIEKIDIGSPAPVIESKEKKKDKEGDKALPKQQMISPENAAEASNYDSDVIAGLQSKGLDINLLLSANAELHKRQALTAQEQGVRRVREEPKPIGDTLGHIGSFMRNIKTNVREEEKVASLM